MILSEEINRWVNKLGYADWSRLKFEKLHRTEFIVWLENH